MVLGSRAAMGYVLGRGAGAAAAAWWLSGGVSAANCVAAYQPIGAASLAASYSNLANPGVFDAAPGTAPTFDTATGWTFLAGSAQYLTTGITPSTGWSAIVRFSDSSGINDACLFGSRQTTNQTEFYIMPTSGSSVRYANWGRAAIAPSLTSGVLAFSNKIPYRNGSYDNAIISDGSPGTAYLILIGALNGAGTASNFLSGKIQAIAIYNTTLSAVQVAAISAAMAAL